MSTTIEQLDRICTLRQQVAALAEQHEAARKAAIPVDVLQLLDTLAHNHALEQGILEAELADLESSVKTSVLVGGETVKGSSLMAVYVKGRESWDGKGLAGYAIAHPEVLAFKSVGKPSVTIR